MMRLEEVFRYDIDARLEDAIVLHFSSIDFPGKVIKDSDPQEWFLSEKEYADNGSGRLTDKIINPSDVTARTVPIRDSREEMLASFYEEEKAFLAMKESLLKTHRNKYVAIYGGDVVASDISEPKLIGRFYKKYGNVPVFIEQVTEEEKVVIAPTPFFGKE